MAELNRLLGPGVSPPILNSKVVDGACAPPMFFTTACDEEYIFAIFLKNNPFPPDLDTDVILSEGFGGIWINKDPKTRENTKLEISQSGSTVKVHAWGSCTPTDCDWGTVSGTSSGNSVKILWDQKFVKRTMIISSIGKELKVETISVYEDKRDSKSSIQYFIPLSKLTPPIIVPLKQIIVPSWIKTNAGWWADGQISDESFVEGIKYLIKEGIMRIPETQAGIGTAQEIPPWIKQNADWWSQGQISDESFVNGIQWLIENGIMRIR